MFIKYFFFKVFIFDFEKSISFLNKLVGYQHQAIDNIKTEALSSDRRFDKQSKTESFNTKLGKKTKTKKNY